MACWRQGQAYLYVDHVRPDEPRLIDPAHAWAGQCEGCGGVHFIKHGAWQGCTNPNCYSASGAMYALRMMPPDETRLLVSCWVLGGPYAVLEVMRDEER